MSEPQRLFFAIDLPAEIREQIIRCGGEVHFETRMDALIIRNGEVIGVETNTVENFLGLWHF